jgi:hypothetical protein
MISRSIEAKNYGKGFRSQNPAAALSHASDQNNHSRPQHRQIAVIPLQGFDRGVMSCGNRGQGLSRLHFMMLNDLWGGWV